MCYYFYGVAKLGIALQQASVFIFQLSLLKTYTTHHMDM